MTTNPRVPCLVLGCRCTRRPFADGWSEWICGKHWREVPRAMRRELSSIVRIYRRKFGDNGYWQYPPGSPQRLEAVDLHNAWVAQWEQCKTAAQDAALGI